ncbi:MAG TPA: hypothetical protein VLF67_03730 [Candidatus Saccharimonas sp.]|nr:hypothetical protein [Candidatus Saccharimonas sp.]
MATVELTSYSTGTRTARGAHRVSIQEAFAHIMAAFRGSGFYNLNQGGFCPAITELDTKDERITGSQTTVYNAGSSFRVSGILKSFISHANKIGDTERSDTAKDEFLRQALLAATRITLDEPTLAAVLALPENSFLEIVALAAETGDDVVPYFQAATRA